MLLTRLRSYRQGFTLVELLVAVLILAILMAVALPLYLNAIQNSEKRVARANMQTIANAEQSYKTANFSRGYTTDLSRLSDLGASSVRGPGPRTYFVRLGPDRCFNAEQRPVVVPAGGFWVGSSESSDGCYVPGLTPE